jgi:hypothetical protein
MESGFRQLDPREKGVLEKLLEGAFPGRDELRTQLGSLTARQVEKDGTLILRCDSGSPSPGKHRLAVEGMCKDADGMTISVLLHLNKDGFMHMLEIIKYDGTPIVRPPSAGDLMVLPEETRGQKR